MADLPNGWEPVLSKYFRDGRELSGGQWQRLSVARGMVRDAPVLIWSRGGSAFLVMHASEGQNAQLQKQ